MKKKKSIKTSAENIRRPELLSLLNKHLDDSYYLDVVYYHVRKALITLEYNLEEYESIIVNGRFFGYKDEIKFSQHYDSVLKALGLVLSIRAIMINKEYIKNCYNDNLMFYDLESNVLSWNSHRAIMECIEDEDFCQIYQMILEYKTRYRISDEQKAIFEDNTIKPEYRNADKYYKLVSNDPDYVGKSVIKNNQYLNAEFDEFEIPKSVEYVGDTAFSFCRNLRTLVFTSKVSFGYFPIIECKSLTQIVVTTEYLDYYKKVLPYYEGIISDKKQNLEDIKEATDEHPIQNTIIDESEIEHVYVGIPSADPYIETEIEEEQSVDDAQIDYSLIEKVFEKKVTSYKFFWFWSILYIFNKRKQITISNKHILAQMVAKAWKYAYVEKCDFGNVDQLKKYLDVIKSLLFLPEDSKEKAVEEKVLEFYDIMYLDRILSPLLKNVPCRFLSPWIPFTSSKEVIEKSNDPNSHCLYAIKDNGIVLNEKWLGYLRNEYNVIEEFIKREINSYFRSIKNK